VQAAAEDDYGWMVGIDWTRIAAAKLKAVPGSFVLSVPPKKR